MEGLVMGFSVWQGKSVFITGHTGFKGSWLALWLKQLGAEVTGYALPPETRPNLFGLAGVAEVLARHYERDIRDLAGLTAAMHAAAPDMVFHLAAQPLVRRSYREPLETWEINVMGTARLLEVIRSCPCVKGVVVVTSDKCYENREWRRGYRESDPLGGHDPYAASKAGAELVVQSYRQSFFAAGGPLLASVRAGNVIGGGDFGEDRLLPDAARAVAAKESLLLRNPHATRPWQHVLSALHGYLLLAERLLAGDASFAEPFNFGPDAADNLTVLEVLGRLHNYWPALAWQVAGAASASAPHESQFLYLDSAKSRQRLGWVPAWDLERGLKQTAIWYDAWGQGADMAAVTRGQIEEYWHVVSAS